MHDFTRANGACSAADISLLHAIQCAHADSHFQEHVAKLDKVLPATGGDRVVDHRQIMFDVNVEAAVNMDNNRAAAEGVADETRIFYDFLLAAF